MNPSDDTARNDTQQQPIAQAEPYRTPADVSDTPASGGMFRSPLAWIFAVGVVMAVGGFLTFTMNRVEVVDFGGTRSGPPIEEPYVGAEE